MRQKLYNSHHSGIIKCLSLKSWDINSLVYTNYIFFICIKKQYTFFFQSNVICDKPKIALKTNFITCDHQYCYFDKTHEHSWATRVIDHLQGTVSGPWDHTEICLHKNRGHRPALMEAIYKVKHYRTSRSSFCFSDTRSLTCWEVVFSISDSWSLVFTIWRLLLWNIY